jgi:ribosomal protein L35
LNAAPARGGVQKGSVSALPSERREPFDKSGSGPTSLQIGLQTPHEHKEKEHSHAQNEDQEQREKTFPRSSRWHRQARSSLQTSHLDHKTTKNKRHLRGAVAVHETNMGSIAQMLPGMGV